MDLEKDVLKLEKSHKTGWIILVLGILLIIGGIVYYYLVYFNNPAYVVSNSLKKFATSYEMEEELDVNKPLRIRGGVEFDLKSNDQDTQKMLDVFNNLDVLYSIDADLKKDLLNIKLSSKYQDENLLGLKLFTDGKDNYILLEDLYNKYLKASNTEIKVEEETSDISNEDLKIIINGLLKANGESFNKDDFLREKVTINHDDKKIDVYKNYLVYNNKNYKEIDSKIIENIKANNDLVEALKKVLGEEKYNDLIVPSEEVEDEFDCEFVVYTKGLTNEFVKLAINYRDSESVINIDCDYDTIVLSLKEDSDNVIINIEQNDSYNYIISCNVTDEDGNTALIKLSIIGESIEQVEKINEENAVLIDDLTEEDQNLIMQKLSENKTLTKFIEDISKILNGDFTLEM